MKRKFLMICFISAVSVFGSQFVFGAAAGRPIGRDVNDLLKWKVSRGFGTKMPAVSSDGTLNLSNLGLSSLNGIERIHLKDRWKVRRLRLDRNQLSELHPATINMFPNLESLYLGDNRISSFYPGTFIGLDKVRIVDLKNNQIIALDDLVFQGLRGLEDLDLSRNPLQVLGEGSFASLTRLKKLNFDDTELAEFSISQFMSNPRLTKIFLRNVPLTDEMRRKIAQAPEGYIVTEGDTAHPLAEYESGGEEYVQGYEAGEEDLEDEDF